MGKLIKILFAGIVFSMFYFPFEFAFLPGYNTKKVMAAVGLVIGLFACLRGKNFKVPYNILMVTVYAAVVSLMGVLSVVCNATPDYVYSSYIVSMLVWLFAAYTACTVIKSVHGCINIELVSKYVIGVCVFQCIIAQIIDSNPDIRVLIDTYILQGQRFLHEVNRLYGIGASLDVAGTRFSIALVLMIFLIKVNYKTSSFALWLYLFLYILILVLGSMIARTTYVGAVVSMVYIIVTSDTWDLMISKSGFKVILMAVIALSIAVPIFAYLYDTNPQVHQWLRFAFEGFFNMAETGEWSIASNEKLKTMYVFPDNLKTWIIGDGYFNNPINVDPYYVGEVTGGYYMGTDVGYLRFIFYFGLLGLFSFMLFFVRATQYCISSAVKYKWMFVQLLLVNFIVWFKVSTDIFLIFAILLCVINMQGEAPQLEDEI